MCSHPPHAALGTESERQKNLLVSPSLCPFVCVHVLQSHPTAQCALPAAAAVAARVTSHKITKSGSRCTRDVWEWRGGRREAAAAAACHPLLRFLPRWRLAASAFDLNPIVSEIDGSGERRDKSLASQCQPGPLDHPMRNGFLVKSAGEVQIQSEKGRF